MEKIEQHIEELSGETKQLLHKTNKLADDLQDKSARLNTAVDAISDIGESVQKLNQTIQKITRSVTQQIEANQEKVSQIVQWSQVILQLKDKWQERKMAKKKLELGGKQLREGADN